MANNLIQKISEGKYTKKELEEIEDAVKYAQHTYQIVEDIIAKADRNEYKRERLGEIDKNLKNLNEKLKKTNKKQAKYVLAMAGVSLPILCALCVISAFNPSLLVTLSAISVGALALASIPIGFMDYKRKKLLAEIKYQENARADVLSDACFIIKTEFANNVYKENKKEKSADNEIVQETDNTFNV